MTSEKENNIIKILENRVKYYRQTAIQYHEQDNAELFNQFNDMSLAFKMILEMLTNEDEYKSSCLIWLE